MKPLAGIVAGALVLGVLGLLAVGKVPITPAIAASAEEAVGAELLLGVPSMTCGSCEGRITRALEKEAGVQDVVVDLRLKTVRVSYDPLVADPKALAGAVTLAGYPARYLPGNEPPPVPSTSRGSGCGAGCCAN